MKQWYEKLFENYAQTYDNLCFTQGTEGEVNFIEQEINFDRKMQILDVGCGTGRHAVELAKRGYSVLGFDLSEVQLSKAHTKAREANVTVEFRQADARNFNFDKKFDLAIMLCEGAFSLMETDDMNFAILDNVAKSLNSGGKLIFTTLNGLFPLFHSVKDFINSNAPETISENNTFDLMTFRDCSDYEVIDDSGNKITLHCNERYYVPSEITWLLKSLNFEDIGIYGCKLGNYSREHKLTTNDYEMLIVAKKK